MKQYKLVAGPTTSQILDKNADNSSAVARFEQIIKEQVAQGWQYHSMEPITTQKTEGCMFSKQVVTTTFYMLVFEKEM